MKKLLLLFLSISIFSALAGQEVIEYKNPKSYEIASLEVEGAQFSDIATLKSISGLRVGKVIRIPGPNIQAAINGLWRLRLFEDVQVEISEVNGDLVHLVLRVVERPTLGKYGYAGVKKSSHEDLNKVVQPFLVKGSIVTDHMKNNAIRALERHYEVDGFYDAKISVIEKPNEGRTNSVLLEFEIDRGSKVKIQDIIIVGNTDVKSKKIRKVMETKRKSRFLAKSRYIKRDLDSDHDAIEAYYNSLGYRDAKVVGDSVWRDSDSGHFMLELTVDEGNQYYFGDIKWKGNSLYTDEELGRVLGIEKGDVYSEELLQTRLSFSLDGRDVSSLYLDDGYLFFSVQPTEVAVYGDTIDLEMRMYEGAQARVDKVIIRGNDRTHDHVVRRELRTRPGKKFSRADIIRSQRQITNLGYFNPESIQINTPVNQQKGTVDIEYVLEETPSDQLELSAGFGGFGGVVGTLGVSFNNFSIRNALTKGAWNPVPQGDGQRLSIRAQTNGRFFQSYNLSFTEPWLGGKKPNSLSVGGVLTSFDRSQFGAGKLQIGSVYAGLGTQMKWPDDYFSRSTTVNLQFIDLDNYGGFTTFLDNQVQTVRQGRFNNFSIKQILQRNSISEPLFPRSGSKISLTAQFTPPYSWFKEDKFWELSDSEKEALISQINQECEVLGCEPLTETQEEFEIQQAENERRFKYLEYHKWRIDAEWYFSLVGKLVLRTSAKIGLLGTYSNEIGFSPFERAELGGDGLSNQQAGITGKDIVALRGYEVNDLAANNAGGATVFNKYTLELRYPLSTNPTSTIYAMLFAEGGNAWLDPSEYNPFDLRRTVGGGVRVFLPMFGLLGFDYGFGFDKPTLIESGVPGGEFGKFSIILGFEPD